MPDAFDVIYSFCVCFARSSTISEMEDVEDWDDEDDFGSVYEAFEASAPHMLPSKRFGGSFFFFQIDGSNRDLRCVFSQPLSPQPKHASNPG